MGAIVGGAIGSVVGMSIAPKSGKETREFLAQKGKDLYEKGKEIGTQGKEPPVTEPSPVPKKFLSKLADKVFHRKKHSKKTGLPHQDEMKKIPQEME